MPFMVVDEHKMQIDNDTFYTMNQFIQDDIQTSSEEPRRQSRLRDDGTFYTKPFDSHYFKKDYQNKFKPPFTCPHCGRSISNNTNSSKHKNTKKCRNVQNFC